MVVFVVLYIYFRLTKKKKKHVWVVQGKGKAAGEASEHCIGSSSVLVVKGLGAYADL